MLRPAGAYKAMQKAYEMAGVTPQDVNVAEVHDCFTVMGAIATEVIGKESPGEGAKYWVEGKGAPGWPGTPVRDQPLRRPDRERSPDWSDRHCDAGNLLHTTDGARIAGFAEEERECGGYV